MYRRKAEEGWQDGKRIQGGEENEDGQEERGEGEEEWRKEGAEEESKGREEGGDEGRVNLPRQFKSCTNRITGCSERCEGGATARVLFN